MAKKPKSLRTLQRGFFPSQEINLWICSKLREKVCERVSGGLFPSHKTSCGHAQFMDMLDGVLKRDILHPCARLASHARKTSAPPQARSSHALTRAHSARD
jgi:hypothetical protein